MLTDIASIAELKRVEDIPLNLALGIVFNTETKKVLIAKLRDYSAWSFPGGKIEYGKDLGSELKKKIKEKTGLNIENLGAIFAETRSERNGVLSIYYLCEFINGKEKLCEQFEELKWVSPDEIEEHFDMELHPHLREYLVSIK